MKEFEGIDYELEIKKTEKTILILSLVVLGLTVCFCGFFLACVPCMVQAMDKALVCSKTGMSAEEYDDLIAMVKEKE
jgi:hypothetical protein